jgi:hypothetical protein
VTEREGEIFPGQLEIIMLSEFDSERIDPAKYSNQAELYLPWTVSHPHRCEKAASGHAA